MKTSKKLSFSEKIIRRNWILRFVLLLMFVYMVVVGELGLGDSRYMSRMAADVSRLIFFGGMIWVIRKIILNKKLLSNKDLLKEKMQQETDEWNQRLYEKSGGIVWDIVLISQLFITLTTSLMNMPAFYASFSTLMVLVATKAVIFFYFKRNGF